MDQDDDFDFSDDGLDDLPANTLQQLETTAIQATQSRARNNAPESDYGLDDGDEVINLDDTVVPPQASPWAAVDTPNLPRAPPQGYDYSYNNGNANGAYDGAMELDEHPRLSQVNMDPQMLLRIKKVWLNGSVYRLLLMVVAGAGEGPAGQRTSSRESQIYGKIWRG